MTHPSASYDPAQIKAMFLSADDLNVAASILYNAYFDDPVFSAIFDAQKEEYDARLRNAIREELNAFWDADQVLLGLFNDTRLLAVACLVVPDAGFAPAQMWHWRVKMMLTAGWVSTQQLIEKENKIIDAIPAQHFHMLALVGVHPDHQHHGLGHLLMQAVDSVVEAHPATEGVGVFATSDSYKAFFEDTGFSAVTPLTVADITGNILYKSRPAAK